MTRKLFFHVRLKMKSLLKVMKQSLRAFKKTTTAVYTLNNKIRNILDKHPQ